MTSRQRAEQLDLATADSRTFFLRSDKEIHMTTNKPVELGRVSEETKEWSPGPIDHIGSLLGPNTA